MIRALFHALTRSGHPSVFMPIIFRWVRLAPDTVSGVHMPRLLALLFSGAFLLAVGVTAAHAQTGPVILTQQPDTKLDTEARTLMSGDIERAKAKGDQPVVLIGSAPLSSRKGDVALFVQVQSASLCGSAGCSTTVYLRHNNQWSKVLDSVSGPVTVMAQSHGGMRDLKIDTHDVWRWRGSEYQDAAPNAALDEDLRQSVKAHQAATKKSGGAGATTGN